jgi:hypothetical protein
MSKPAKQDLPALFALPNATEPITPEIDNLEEEVIGEAVLKDFVPGTAYFDYQNILNQKIAKSTDKESRKKAIREAQSWLLSQMYEVIEPDGKIRPLGLNDISLMEGEQLAFTVADIMSVNLVVNFLDGKDLETSFLFEITDKAQRFRVQRLSVEKGVDIQEISRDDPTGVQLTKWLITAKITLNDLPITAEDFDTTLDFQTTILLASKINFLLGQFQQRKTSFSLRSIRTGRTPTSK